MPKTCFVIGPIGDPGSAVRAAADDFMDYIVSPCPALRELEYGDPIRADHLNEPGRITSQVIKLLIEADLVIADLTSNNANVYYELSLRHAIAKPAIHMALEGTQLSFDVRDNRTIFYTMHSRVAEQAKNDLAKQIQHVHQQGYKPSNPIIETAGIIKLEQSADPQQNAIGQLMRMVEGLSEQIASIRQQNSGIHNLVAGGLPGYSSTILNLPPGGGKSTILGALSDNQLERTVRILKGVKFDKDDS